MPWGSTQPCGKASDPGTLWEPSRHAAPGACGRTYGRTQPPLELTSGPRVTTSVPPSREEPAQGRGPGQFPSGRAGRAVAETGRAVDHHLGVSPSEGGGLDALSLPPIPEDALRGGGTSSRRKERGLWC